MHLDIGAFDEVYRIACRNRGLWPTFPGWPVKARPPWRWSSRTDFEAVRCLPCQGRTLGQLAGELAWQLGLKHDGELDSVVRHLTGHCAGKRYLLVLDNVEGDTSARLMPAGRTSVLITTRLTNLRFLRFYQPLSLPLFTEQQCFELFREIIGKEEVGRDEAEAGSLFQRLGYLPSASPWLAGSSARMCATR